MRYSTYSSQSVSVPVPLALDTFSSNDLVGESVQATFVNCGDVAEKGREEVYFLVYRFIDAIEDKYKRQ